MPHIFTLIQPTLPMNGNVAVCLRIHLHLYLLTQLAKPVLSITARGVWVSRSIAQCWHCKSFSDLIPFKLFFINISDANSVYMYIYTYIIIYYMHAMEAYVCVHHSTKKDLLSFPTEIHFENIWVKLSDDYSRWWVVKNKNNKNK